uniref:NAD(+) kinase n=1 Tax=Steinernema glaseri TaxID=37863 RepID=A0A1I8AUG5_9BILA
MLTYRLRYRYSPRKIVLISLECRFSVLSYALYFLKNNVRRNSSKTATTIPFSARLNAGLAGGASRHHRRILSTSCRNVSNTGRPTTQPSDPSHQLMIRRHRSDQSRSRSISGDMGLMLHEAALNLRSPAEALVLNSNHHHQHCSQAASVAAAVETDDRKSPDETTPSSFMPHRVVILSKTTRLQYELQQCGHLDESGLIEHFRRQGTDFEELKRKHCLQSAYVCAIREELRKSNIDARVVLREDYTSKLVEWSDLIISAGGDGTFLTAASKVDDRKPVIGINTDPIGSEGHLCLTGKLQIKPQDVIRQVLDGQFTWAQRQRIRVTIVNQNNENDENGLLAPVDDYDMAFKGVQLFKRESIIPKGPILALNEVFIGESHAARVSYYEVQIDDGPTVKQKSSGITVCTGTGSTSWHYNINRLSGQNVSEMLDIMRSMGMQVANNDSLVHSICQKFNEKLIFEPDSQKMAFTVRDPVFNATFASSQARGFARRIRLKSRCSDAQIVLDGSTSIPFNHGTEVILEMLPDDALRTIHLT